MIGDGSTDGGVVARLDAVLVHALNKLEVKVGTDRLRATSMMLDSLLRHVRSVGDAVAARAGAGGPAVPAARAGGGGESGDDDGAAGEALAAEWEDEFEDVALDDAFFGDHEEYGLESADDDGTGARQHVGDGDGQAGGDAPSESIASNLQGGEFGM